jgi:hypothetical protein
MPRTRPPYPPEFRRQAVELLRAGTPLKQVAEELSDCGEHPSLCEPRDRAAAGPQRPDRLAVELQWIRRVDGMNTDPHAGPDGPAIKCPRNRGNSSAHPPSGDRYHAWPADADVSAGRCASDLGWRGGRGVGHGDEEADDHGDQQCDAKGAGHLGVSRKTGHILAVNATVLVAVSDGLPVLLEPHHASRSARVFGGATASAASAMIPGSWDCTPAPRTRAFRDA